MMKATFKLTRADFELDVDLNIPDNGVTVLFGPSGAGKSTILRCIAGLERPEGKLKVNGETWQNNTSFLPPHKRQVAYVFQEPNLFPHLTVMQNLQYGIKRQKQNDKQFILDALISLMGIEHLLARKPVKLSGGEKQRVAIARALATSPKVLLMDEPMATLDMARKQEILPFLEKLRDELSIPILYVTHSNNELVRLAENIVLLNAGKVVAQGDLNSTMALMDRQLPSGQTPGVVIKAAITDIDTQWHLAKASFNGGDIWLRNQGFKVQQNVRFMVMDKDVSITTSQHIQTSSISNSLPAEIVDIVDGDHPAICIVRLKLGDNYLLSRLTHKSLHELQIKAGDQVYAQVKLAAIIE